MKKVLIAIAVVWAFIAIGLMVVPRMDGWMDYRALLIDRIEARTGRTAHIDGDVRLELLPSPRLIAEGVRIANIPGAPSADVIKVRRAVFQVERGSVLSRKLRVTGVTLEEPKIYLDVLADGRRSWTFTPEKRPGKGQRPLPDGFTASKATILYRDGSGEMMLTGDLAYDGSGERPRLDASLKGGRISLDPFLGARDSGPDKVKDGGRRWSEKPIDIALLRGADGRLAISADEIRYRRYVFDKPSVTAVLDHGQLRLEQAGAGLFGGRLEIKGTVDARAVPALTLDVALQGAAVEKALSDWADKPFANGDFGMTASLAASGGTQYDMIRSLSGTARIDAKGGVVRGFDAARLSGDLAGLTRYSDFIDLADTALAGGQTRYQQITGTLKIAGGVAVLDNVTARLEAARATASGTVDLPRWAIDLDLSLNLTAPEHKGTPPVGMALSGSLDAPRQKNRLTAMGKFVGKKLVNTVIDDVLGDDEPHYDDAAPGERRQKTRRVVNRLLDKLEKRRERRREKPYQDERAYRDEREYSARRYAPPPYEPDRYEPDRYEDGPPMEYAPDRGYPPDGYHDSGRAYPEGRY